MMKLHPHAVGKIMATQKKAGEVLSEGAKTYLRMLAKREVYGYARPELGTKEIKKGLACEDDAIDLLNTVLFTDFQKHVGRVENDWLTGECDILAEDCIFDTKCSWSLETFPAQPEDGENTDYEWQGRAYMLLYDRPRFTLAYCMVSTPDDLIGYESHEVHKVDHIAPEMRLTLIRFDRDADKEAKLIDKCKAAQAYIAEQIKRIKAAHQY